MFSFLRPWLRSDVRLTGRFGVQWLRGFERVEGLGEELSADEMIVTFKEEPPKAAMRIQFEINGKRLVARIKPHKVYLSEKPSKSYRCVCRFSMMGPSEKRQLDDLLESAPDPPYKRERITRAPRRPIFRARHRRPENITIPAEIEAKIVSFLLAQKRIAPPSGKQRPLLAIKSAERLSEDGQDGTSYRVRSRMVNSHGGTKTFDTPLFVPDKGDVRMLT